MNKIMYLIIVPALVASPLHPDDGAPGALERIAEVSSEQPRPGPEIPMTRNDPFAVIPSGVEVYSGKKEVRPEGPSPEGSPPRRGPEVSRTYHMHRKIV